jgi:hypothetical protein
LSRPTPQRALPSPLARSPPVSFEKSVRPVFWSRGPGPGGPAPDPDVLPGRWLASYRAKPLSNPPVTSSRSKRSAQNEEGLTIARLYFRHRQSEDVDLGRLAAYSCRWRSRSSGGLTKAPLPFTVNTYPWAIKLVTARAAVPRAISYVATSSDWAGIGSFTGKVPLSMASRSRLAS